MNNDILEQLKDVVLFEKVTPELHLAVNNFLKTELGGEWDTHIHIQPNSDTTITCNRLDHAGEARVVIEITSEEIA
jgi:hypothetical protein